MPAFIGGAVGLAQTVTGLINSGKTKKRAAELERNRPLLKDSQFLDDQLNLAKSEMANGGLSGKAQQIYDQGNDRSLSASLNAILKGGGDVNNVADVFDRSAEGRSRLALLNDNLRLSQINNLVKAQDANEEFRQQQFGLNEYAPWKDKVAANAAARTAAQNQIWQGIGQVGSAAISAFAPKLPTGNSGGGAGMGSTLNALTPVSASTMQTIPISRTTPSPAANYPTIPQLNMPSFNTDYLPTASIYE
jgi:hypothetical protein